MQKLFLHWERIFHTKGMGIKMKKIIISIFTVLVTVLCLVPVYADVNISSTDNLLNAIEKEYK